MPMNQPGISLDKNVDIASKIFLGPKKGFPGPPGSPGGIHEEGLPRDGGRASRGGCQQRGPLVELTRPGKRLHRTNWKITHFNGKIWE